jgi:hypothetical protein
MGYLTNCEEEKINKNGKDYYYLNNLTIFRDLLEKIPESSESYDIWHHYFPENWKITEKNFKKSIIPRVWWHDYVNMADSKINTSSEKIDNQLEQVSEGLLPGINPITWSIILTFAVRSWSDDKRMENLIEQQRIFGFSVSGDGNSQYSEEDFWENFKKEIVEKEDYTVSLACFLLRGSFRDIDQCLKSLEKLKFEDKDKENHRLEIVGIFKKIKSCLDKIPSGQPVGN